MNFIVYKNLNNFNKHHKLNIIINKYIILKDWDQIAHFMQIILKNNYKKI